MWMGLCVYLHTEWLLMYLKMHNAKCESSSVHLSPVIRSRRTYDNNQREFSFKGTFEAVIFKSWLFDWMASNSVESAFHQTLDSCSFLINVSLNRKHHNCYVFITLIQCCIKTSRLFLTPWNMLERDLIQATDSMKSHVLILYDSCWCVTKGFRWLKQRALDVASNRQGGKTGASTLTICHGE